MLGASAARVSRDQPVSRKGRKQRQQSGNKLLVVVRLAPEPQYDPAKLTCRESDLGYRSIDLAATGWNSVLAARFV